jgi:PAS domain S-box-containing protein
LSQSSVTPQIAPPRLHFRVPPQPSHLLRARERLRDYLRQYCTERQVIDDVTLCVEEACTNAIRHCGSADDIEIVVRFTQTRLVATVKDHGRGFDVARFDPGVVPDPTLDHGRGLFIIAALMDSLELRVDGGLEVRMARRADARCEPVPLESGLGEPQGSGGHSGHGDSRTRIVLEEIDEAFVALDWEYRYVFANGHACRLLGTSRDEMLGHKLLALFPKLRGSALERGFRAAMELGVPSAMEWRSPILDAWVETRIYPTSAGVTAYFHDIDERKRKELQRDELLAALRDSEERYRQLFQSESDAILLIDHESGRLLEANPAAAATYGYTTEELVGLTDLDLSGEPEVTRSTTQAAVVGENVAVPTRMHRRKDGTTFAVEMTGRVFSLQGRMVRVAAVRDVTARKRAEEALGRFELLAANSRDIILFMDRDGRIIEANAAAGHAYGYSRDELLNLTIADLRAAQTEAEMASQMKQADERGILFESLHRRKDGAVFAVEVSSRGATIGGRRTLVSVVRDITERKWAEEALRGSEERFRSLFEHMSQAASLNELVYGADGAPCDVRFLEVNPAFERQTGLKADDVVGRTTHDVYDVDDPLWLERYGEVVRTGRPAHFEERFGPLDRWYEVWAYRTGPRRFAALSADVTERKQAQRAREEASRLGEALNAIDALVHSSLNSDEIIQTTLREGAQAIGAEQAGVSLHEDDAQRFRVAYLHNHPPDKIGVLIPDSEDTHGVEAMRTGKTLAIDDAQTDPRVVRVLMDAWQIKSVICAPLIVQGRPIGVVYYSYRSASHRFSEAEIDFMTRLASSLSTAVQNATLYEAQRDIAVTLQENFMHELPVVAGLGLGLVTRAADARELVGGDFSDAFVLDDGRVAILIGDVAGKGVRAAGLAETVRSTVRAFATCDASPAFILARTNELLLRYDAGEPHVTAFLAVLDPRAGRLSYASAGHPAAIHLGAVTCRPLDVTFGPPLGTFRRTYEDAQAVLTPRDYLVLYTDGVTEARRDGEFLGERRLLEILEGLRGRSAQEVAEGVRDAASDFADGRLNDDLQVVVLRLA